MHTQQFEIVLFSLTLLSLFIKTVHSQPLPSSSPDGEDFIRTSCNTTLYPDICFTSLSSYATKIKHDRTRLAYTAFIVALSNTQGATSYVSTISDPSSVAVLRECISCLRTASSEISRSLKQIEQMATTGSQSKQFRFWVSNVQTWMASALTYDETCKDEFDILESSGSGSGSAMTKEEVIGRVDEVKKITSNALALFNHIYPPN